MDSTQRAHRFPFKRIAVTVPPGDWFHGIARAQFDIYRGELAALGLEIFDVPAEIFLLPDVVRIDRIVSDLKAFQPELAIGLHKGAYALLCRLAAGRDGWRPNVFTEVLDIPMICLWDHAPLELAEQLLFPHADKPGASVAGAQETLRRSLTHPRLMHWSPDTGQTQLMKELGLVLADRVIEQCLPTLPGFQPTIRSQPAQDHVPAVAFVGHFYQDLPNHPHPALTALAKRVIGSWIRETWVHKTSSGARSRTLWEVMSDQIGALDPDLRKRLALHREQSYFWHFAHRLTIHEAQTALRLKVLGLAGVPVTCYGNLNTDLPGVSSSLIPAHGHIPYGPALAACLTRHTITIDVFSPGSIRGFSHKPMITFAAGGFMLVDRKADLIAAFGDAGEAVSYGPGAEDLAVKLDLFLTNPAYLREVGDAIRETISARFQLRQVLARVMETAFERAGGSGGGSARVHARQRAEETKTNAIANLLPTIRSDSDWPGASAQHLDGKVLIVAPQQWCYAAKIPIPKSVKRMREPHLRVNLLVETGRVGVAAVLDTGALIAEQHVSATEHAVSLTVELPTQGASIVILRNSAATASRVLVLEATLCDRASRMK